MDDRILLYIIHNLFQCLYLLVCDKMITINKYIQINTFTPKMNKNFMNNLSDQVIKQNYKLKDELIQAKKKAKDYQQKITEMVTAIDPQYLIIDNFKQMADKFSAMIVGQKKSYEELKGIYQHVSVEMQAVKEQNISMIKQMQQKSADDEENIELWLNERATLVQNCNKYKLQAQSSKELYNQLKQQHNGLKIQKLKIQQNKRQEIQSSYVQHHVQMMSIKNKVERQHMRAQRLLREEIENKNQAIKDMSKYIQDLQKVQSERIMNEGLEEMFVKLKEYNNLSQTINQIRIQNSLLREGNKELQNAKKNIQVKFKESKGAQQNLQSQLQRTNIFLQEVQTKLTDKLQYLAQLEKEKEEMDKYYSQRWVQQYKRVKNRLTKDFVKKITQVQDNYNSKMAVMDAKMTQAIKARSQIIRKNEILQSRFQADAAAKQNMKEEISGYVQKVGQFKVILRESQQMAGEQGLVWIQTYEHQKNKLKQNIKVLKEGQENKSSQLQSFKEYHRQTINELNRKNIQQIQQKQVQYQRQKKKDEQLHRKAQQKLKQKIQKTFQSAQEAQKFSQLKYQKQLQQIQRKHKIQLGQKDQQIQRKHQKWLDKFYQLDNISNYNKNKMEREKLQLRREMAVVQDRNKELGKIRDKLKDKIKQIGQQNKQLKVNVAMIQGQLQEAAGSIDSLNKKINKMEKQLDSSQREVQVLIRMRKQWKKQLMSLQFDFKEQFTELKKQVDKQKQILKQKISQLQDLNKRKAVNRKQYQQLKDLHEQRDTLKEQVHVRQTQNVILTQIKDYYETQLRQAQNKITKNQLRQTHSIITRKIKRSKIRPKKESVSLKEGDNVHEELPDVKRYAINSYQKQFNLSLNKARLEQFNQNKHYRVKTSYGQ